MSLRSFIFLVALLLTHSFITLSHAQSKGQFDGPAELPRILIDSGLAQTPSPGKSIPVKDARELQTALNDAHCGDKIILQAGTRFEGNFKFPAKNCDDSHWILVRTSAEDNVLPAEGNRITPCYAGLTSLPGRPPYACASAKNVLAKLVSTTPNAPTIAMEDGANHYRLMGLEITRESPAVVYNLIMMFGKGTNHHFVFDRDWIHGTAQDETTRGIALATSTYVSVVDSYFSDFHCVAITGSCGDSQAIAGGLGDSPMGPYKIVNNYLESSGENLMFGGGPATLSPADIEIRHNHLFKPLTWMLGSDGFVGGRSGKPFIVKNLFELKNAQRVLFEGNLLENSWGGFTQAGFAVLLTPKNQNNKCPLCRTTDITIRYCRITHMASGLVMGTGLSDTGGAASGGARYSIHDVVFDDIEGKALNGFGALFQVSSKIPALTDVSINHVTGFPPTTLFVLGVDVDREKIANFSFTNNLVGIGINPIFPTGGGPKNCSFQPVRQGPLGVFKSCFTTRFEFTHNGVIGSSGGWPPGNFSAKGIADVHMLASGQGKGGDYRLCASKSQSCPAASPFYKQGSDGKDVGADLELVNAATEGVI